MYYLVCLMYAAEQCVRDDNFVCEMHAKTLSSRLADNHVNLIVKRLFFRNILDYKRWASSFYFTLSCCQRSADSCTLSANGLDDMGFFQLSMVSFLFDLTVLLIFNCMLHDWLGGFASLRCS